MLNDSFYTFIILSIAGGLLTLLSSVGIFISLIIQRRLDRLQTILEEFIDLSYHNETNLTGLMYKLIEKYQMYYIFPLKPRVMILMYIDLNIFLILALWTVTFFMQYRPPLSPVIILQILPLLVGIFASLFFRYLLRDTINIENPLFDTIVPAPVKLRSISYLSRFVNLSVKSVLKQARLTVFLYYSKDNDDKKDNMTVLKVNLKEELSFDDFFYFLSLSELDNPLFVSFGEIRFRFLPDPVTGKPMPVRRNVNVPLGNLHCEELPARLTAVFLVFVRGEKHPLEFIYPLEAGTNFYSSQENPQITVNHQILYSIEKEKITINQCDRCPDFFREFSHLFRLNGNRYYVPGIINAENLTNKLRTCREEVFID